MKDEVEVPGALCPVCSHGKLIINYLKTWDSIYDKPGGRGARAQFHCTNTLCNARLDATADLYALGLAQALVNGNAANAERFRETIGGFQFTD